MNLDIILIMDTMDIITGAVVITGITTVAAAMTYGPKDRKVQSCIDAYTFTDGRSFDFIQCMKGHFPEKFADAYKRKLESDSKLSEIS